MPYRIDVHEAGPAMFDRLVELGAIDVESSGGGIAALMPDSVTPEQVADGLGVRDFTLSPGIGRDADSVWILKPREVRVGRVRIVPDDGKAEPGAIRLIDAMAFGTGLHPTTALCLEALDEIVQARVPDAVLDIGTGSGVLALAALMLGVPHALAIDVDDEALRVATENARINGLADRLQSMRGGPDAITGSWSLVLANVLAGPLIEMAPALVRRVGRRGNLVISGIPSSVEHDVERAYRRLGMRRVAVKSRSGWSALVMHASW